MAFQFRLEKILHFLRLKETMKKMEIVSVQKRLSFLENRQQSLERNSRELLAQHSISFYHTTKIAWDAKEAGRLDAQISEEKSHLAKLRTELQRLMQRKKGLEALREKKEHEYRLDQAQREQKQADDAYLNRRDRRH